jgi:hypothetical protein
MRETKAMREAYSTPRDSARSARSAFFCFARKFDMVEDERVGDWRGGEVLGDAIQ